VIEPGGGKLTDLRTMAAAIPLVGDGLLMRLGNDMRGAARDVEFRSGRGPLSRLWNKLAGNERKERDHLDTKLISNQRRTALVIHELGQHLRVTNLAMTQLADELGEIVAVARRTEGTAERARAEVRELAQLTFKAIGVVTERLDQHDWMLADHSRQLREHAELLDVHDAQIARHEIWLEYHDKVLDEHLEILRGHDARLIESERRQLVTELWQTAQTDFDDAVRRWEQHGAYADLPWVAQIVLLAREVASAGAGLHAFATGDGSYQQRLEGRIKGRPFDGAWTGRRALERILNDAAAQSLSDDHRLIVAELLGAGEPEADRVPDTPLARALATTMELYCGPQRPMSPAAEALARVDYILPSMTVGDVIRHAVREQVDAVRKRRETLLERRRLG
jgi:hypothetical protein